MGGAVSGNLLAQLASADDNDLVGILNEIGVADSTKQKDLIEKLSDIRKENFHQIEAEEVARRIYTKGFSLGQLLEFVNTKCFESQIITESWSTSDVVNKIVIPETASRGCCYSDIFPGGPKEPETLMSHWWGNTFLHLVQAICQHAAGKSELFSHMYTAEEKAKTYWLCIFGINQHISICKNPWINCPCPNKYADKNSPNFEMDKFPLVMKHIRQHGLALDSDLKTLTRVWVLSELDTAMNLCIPPLPTKYCGEVGRDVLQNPNVSSIRNAEASFIEDKIHILGLIEGRPHGIEVFDDNISKSALYQIAVIRIFNNVRNGKVEEVANDLIKWSLTRPEIINVTDLHGRGETFLMLSARYGNIRLVRLLLELKSNPFYCTSTGWNALHYAAICFNPETQLTVIEMLLDSGGLDPNLKNGFGRTALEEAHYNSQPNAAHQLLHARTDNADKLIKNLVSELFHPLPDDSYYFSHTVLRQDSWQRPDIVMKIRQPINGEIKVYNNWVKPIEFGTKAEEIVHSESGKKIIYGARRISAYLKYRWPLWEFHCIQFAYSTENDPANYRVNLIDGTLAQINRNVDEDKINVLKDSNAIHTTIPSSVRFLYP